MNNNSVIAFSLHSYTLIASLTQEVLRLTLEVNHSEEVIFQSSRLTSENLAPDLKVLFETARGFYEYIYKVITTNQVDKIGFNNGILNIKVSIEGRIKSVPIKMRKMVEEKEIKAEPFLLTSISSDDEQKQSRASIGLLSKLQKEGYPAPRLKLMMIRENNKIRKAMTKIPQQSSSPVSKDIRSSQQYPYLKPQGRYIKMKTEDNYHVADRKSYSQNKTTMYNYQRSLNLRKNMKESNLDLSNKQLRVQDIKELVSYEWPKLILLNIGYNNIGSEGLALLTSIRWPCLKTLYVCFNNILKIEWKPSNICFLKTLSLSGNKIKEIPRNIIELEFLQELFIYNNKIQVIPEEISLMEELKNLSIYGNQLDFNRNRKVLLRLKTRKVQVWQ